MPKHSERSVSGKPQVSSVHVVVRLVLYFPLGIPFEALDSRLDVGP